jgi:hypothetical protein
LYLIIVPYYYTITLLDLKNAFGEVHHNLIQSVLDYHIPEHIKFVINSLYTDFQTSTITSEFRTPFISVRRGVLQGDCLSPLLFSMCFNTFIQHIEAEKYRQFGFSFKLLNPIHWFQFADDAAVITSQESENQHLLNRFSIWCQWSNMIIDPVVNQYIRRRWLEIPISGTLSTVFLTCNKFGQSIYPPSVKFIQQFFEKL